MPVCTVCGEKDFEEHDGHYFCTLCNTQSQDVRVLVVEEENFQNFSRTGQIREPTTPRRNKKPVDEGDQGRPWSVYEAYQIIIRHQIDALIKLGADKSLKDVVFQIWVNYLSRLGVAFSDDQETKVTYERQRDLFRSTTEKPRIKNILAMRSLKKSRGLSATKVRKQMEKDETIVALQDEEFYEGDNPLGDDGDSEKASRDDSSDSSEVEDDKEEERWGRYRKSLKYNAVEKVRMISTISICYLGLMYTNPLTTITDLIRWIRQKKIPYLDIRSILPEDMKFCLNDWKLFGFGVPPTMKEISHNTGKIASFINLHDIPAFPMEELINKYIIQLDLPVEFHGYAINLWRRMPVELKYTPNNYKKYTVFWEGIAMSYVIILLKLIFGLTDHHEMLLSEYTKELVEITGYGQPLFVWTDWVQHMKKKIQLQELQDEMSVDRSHIASGKLGDRIKSTNYMSKVKLYSRRFKESIAQPISELSHRWKLRNSSNNLSGTGDHVLYSNQQNNDLIDFDMNTLDEEDPLIQLSNSLETSMNTSITRPSGTVGQHKQFSGIEKDMSVRSAKFRKSTIQHILSPDTYLAIIQNRLEGQGTNEDLPENDAILSELFSSELFDSPSARAKRRRMDNTRKGISKKRSNSLNSTYIDEESEKQTQLVKYKEVIDKLKDVLGDMKTTLDYESPNYCLSYDWLLKICSNCIDYEIEELQHIILKMEVMYFCDDKFSLSELGQHHYETLRDVSKGPEHFTKKLNGLKREIIIKEEVE